MLAKLPIQAGAGILEMLQSRYPGYHPLLAIAEIAHEKSSDDVQLQFNCHKTIAEYILPKLRAVEHSGSVENQRRVIVQLFQDDIEDGQLVDKEETGLSDTELLKITDTHLLQDEFVLPEEADLMVDDDELIDSKSLDGFALNKLNSEDFD